MNNLIYCAVEISYNYLLIIIIQKNICHYTDNTDRLKTLYLFVYYSAVFRRVMLFCVD